MGTHIKAALILIIMVGTTQAQTYNWSYNGPTYTKPAAKKLLWTPPAYTPAKSPYSYTPRYTPRMKNYRHTGYCAAQRANYIANQYVHPRSYYVRMPL